MPDCRVTRYAEDIAEGKIVAGQLHRLACERHIQDLSDGHKRGLNWDQDKADHILDWMPAVLSITEGAKEGEPFHPLPWHVFAAGSLFGWRDVNGRRRFREAYIETGKGQAKSPLMAAIGLYMLGFAGVARPDIYCIGEDKDTARVVFNDAVAMARAPIPGMGGETLESIGRFKIRGTGKLAYKIEYLAKKGSMQPIANTDSNSGPKPSAVLGDEIHELKSNRGVETWRDAIAKMAGDPLLLMGSNCPSIDQDVGTNYAQLFISVLKGEFANDSMFALICRTDEGDDPLNDETVWKKSLPAMGITFPIENVRKQVETARIDVSRRFRVERLYFGIPVGSSGFWMDEAKWDESLCEIKEKDNRGLKCHLSLDLSLKNDLTALSAAWIPQPDEKMPVKTWYWTCENQLEKRIAQDRIPYRDLEALGEITIVKSQTIDYRFVAAQVQQIHSEHNVVQMAMDAAFAAQFIDACNEIGFDVWVYEGEDTVPGQGLKIVYHRQGPQIAFAKVDKKTGRKLSAEWLDMPHSVQGLKDGILDGKIAIDKQRLNTICAANVVLRSDAMNNQYFDKKKSRGRIDGMVTKAMAVGSALRDMEAAPSSSYLDDEEMVFL